MEKEGYRRILDNIVNPEAMLAEMPNDKIWLLIGELEDIAEDYEREMAIMYLSCNHSEIKHLCTTYLRGHSDDFILKKMESVKESMHNELKRRRSARSDE